MFKVRERIAQGLPLLSCQGNAARSWHWFPFFLVIFTQIDVPSASEFVNGRLSTACM